MREGSPQSLRLRYFGPRDLTSDGIYRSDATLLFNAGGAEVPKSTKHGASPSNF